MGSVESSREFVAGTVGGFVGKIVEFPMDTVKVLMQTQDVKNPQFKNSWSCFRDILGTSGIPGLYRGLATPLLGSMAEISTLMTTYNLIKRLLGEKPDAPPLNLWQLVVASGGAGVGVSFVLAPVELIKCRLQVQNNAMYKGPRFNGPLDVIYKTAKKEGLRGLTRGMGGTLAREIPGNVAWFGTYEFVCNSFKTTEDEEEKLPHYVYMLAGACAGMAYWTIPYPADTVKSRIQIAGSNGNGGAAMKFWPTLLDIYRKEGFAALYRGWAITCCRAAPSNAAVFYTYEMCVQMMGQEAKGHPAIDSHSGLDLESTYRDLTLEISRLRKKVVDLEVAAKERQLDLEELQGHLMKLRQHHQALRSRTTDVHVPTLPALPQKFDQPIPKSTNDDKRYGNVPSLVTLDEEDFR